MATLNIGWTVRLGALGLWALAGYLVLLVGCSTIPVYVADAPLPPELEAGARLWGMRAEPATSPEGAVAAHPLEDGETCDGGEAFGCAHPDMCRPRIESGALAASWAHELGHVAGLAHVDGPPDQIMLGTAVGADNVTSTSRQRKAIRRLAARLKVCKHAAEL